jgi:sugar-specific transcriptional regulator TrmB
MILELQSMGLTQNEAKVYGELIRVSSFNVSDIVAKTNIHKSNVYTALSGMITKGFVKKIITANEKRFASTDVCSIRSFIDYKRIKEDALLEKIKVQSLTKIDISANSFEVYVGYVALRQLLMGFLEHNSTIYCSGVMKEAVDVLGKGWLHEFHKKRIAKKIGMKLIYNEDAYDRIKEAKKIGLHHIKLLDKSTSMTINVCKEEVLLIHFGRKPVEVQRFCNKDLADYFLRDFGVLWECANDA